MILYLKKCSLIHYDSIISFTWSSWCDGGYGAGLYDDGGGGGPSGRLGNTCCDKQITKLNNNSYLNWNLPKIK